MTERAVEMAKIIDTEMPKGADVERWIIDRFSKDKLSDLKRAVEILTELDAADLAMDDFESMRDAQSRKQM